MGLEHRIAERFTSKIMYHAVGQGALGIEIRTGDTRVMKILEKITDLKSTVCCLAERALMRTLEGGCSVPIGVESSYNVETKRLELRGIVVSVNGELAVEDSQEIYIEKIKEDSMACGRLLAEKMMAKGAKKILDEINLDRIEQ